MIIEKNDISKLSSLPIRIHTCAGWAGIDMRAARGAKRFYEWMLIRVENSHLVQCSYTGCVFLFWAIPFHCLTLEFAVTKLLKHTDNYSKGEDELATCFWFTSLILIPHLGSKFILKLLNTKNQTNTVNTLSCWKCIHKPPPQKKVCFSWCAY